ncbi:MAG: Cyclic di-GMP phosphodiesterase CdpA [Candidatus Erwinia impunctatus]|nr:Cyclic di-GMP phosphodiesterase CdpA [Culicoides impunctatus]
MNQSGCSTNSQVVWPKLVDHYILVQGDALLTLAESQGDSATKQLPDTNDKAPPAEDRQEWFERLELMLKTEQLQLFLQPVVSCQHPGHILHHKVLARVEDLQGNSIVAGKFLPWIHRFGWSRQLDEIMFNKVFHWLQRHDGTLALSLSAETVLNLSLLNEMLSPLKSLPNIARRLILELDEHRLPDSEHFKKLNDLIGFYGCGIGIQHFGGRFDLIGNIAQWGLSYLKVDGRYIREIDKESDKQVFIQALYRATNSIALPLIAERVETAEELATLSAISIQGAMGLLVGEPSKS